MSIDLPDLPNVNSANFLQRVRETLQTLTGGNDVADQVVTVGDLVDSGLVKPPPGGSIIEGGVILEPGDAIVVYEPDLSTPPSPTGVVLTTGLTALFIETDTPAFTAGHGYLRTLVYGVLYPGTGPLPTYEEGVTPTLTEFVGEVGTYAVDPNTIWHVWLKWRSIDGVDSQIVGGVNGFSGTSTQTSANHYGDATIGNAKIVDLAVGKLRAGSISAGEYIRSANYVAGVAGFNIPSNGIAEFSDLTARGTIHATSGTIGSAFIDANSIRSVNYVSGATGWRILADGTIYSQTGINGGAYSGYAWPAAGGTGFHLGLNGLLLGNGNSGGKYVQITAAGDFYAPQFTIIAGAATFSGSLNVVSSGSGDRMEIKTTYIKIFAAGVLRVQIGDLSA